MSDEVNKLLKLFEETQLAQGLDFNNKFNHVNVRIDSFIRDLHEWKDNIVKRVDSSVSLDIVHNEINMREAWQQGCENHLNSIFKFVDELDERLKKFETVEDRPCEDMTPLDREHSLNKARAAAFTEHLDSIRERMSDLEKMLKLVGICVDQPPHLESEISKLLPGINVLNKALKSELQKALNGTNPKTITFDEEDKLKQYKDRCEELLEKNHTQSKSIEVMFKKIHSHDNKIEMLMECLDRKSTKLEELQKEYEHLQQEHEQDNDSYVARIKELQSNIALQNAIIHKLQNPQKNEVKVVLSSCGGGDGGSSSAIGVSNGGGRGSGSYPDGKGNCT